MLKTSLDRRALLRLASLAAGAAILPLGRHAWAANLAPLGERAASKRLVVVMLRGAVDGLSVVAPYGESAYYEARPGIALKPPQPGDADRLLALDGHFGLHPALQPLLPFWQQGSLAFVQACGSPDPTRSHFDAQLFMENGTPGISTTPDGWMNRLVGLLPGPHPATQALSIGPTLPRIMSGKASVANVALGGDPRHATPLDQPAVGAAFAQLYGSAGAQGDAFRQGQAARHAVLADLDDHEQRVANAGAPEARGFAQPAARLAQLMQRDSNISLVFTALGGWDTHVSQGAAQGQLANQLRGLGQGLATLATGLGPAYADTLILVMSEFGRTVHENGNAGTDHGHGNVLWVMGGGVAGRQVYGEWPGLKTAQLYQGRDLAVTTDFRTVLASLVGRHLGLADRQLAALFPAAPRPSTNLAPILRA